MKEILTNTPMFGLLLTIVAYTIGHHLHNRWPYPIFTPLIFSVITIISLLILFDIEYETFLLGGEFIHMMITPATVSLAIILEKNFRYLKKHYPSIFLGVGIGTIAHTLVIIFFMILFEFDQQVFASFFSKSITTAIAISVSNSLGGIESLTIALVIVTGTLGSVLGPLLFKLTHITDPIAQGVALGSGAHAMGTSKAIQLGDVHGAMSGLSIILTGIAYVLLAPLTNFIYSISF
ncbi:LrgB family protein [Marinilactibacillus sp. Marseille-P9653]|uniref:LrgB family protein n=1 Tax=Marinilactibacillus sp. Marseille-P9653 TaxID=2866583 RepID=UPI001CE45656|nr:LrgB family protein [Marinilactibacillus sp. Marseille-P9653]